MQKKTDGWELNDFRDLSDRSYLDIYGTTLLCLKPLPTHENRPTYVPF